MHTDNPQRGVQGQAERQPAERQPAARGYIEYAAPRCHMNPDYFEMAATGLCVRDFALAIKQPLGVKEGWVVEVQSPSTNKRLRGSQWLPSGSAVQVQVVKLGQDPAANPLDVCDVAATATVIPTDSGLPVVVPVVPVVPVGPVVPVVAEVPDLPPSCTMWAAGTVDRLADVVRRIRRLLAGAHTAYVTVTLCPGRACVLGVAVERGSTDVQGPEGRVTCVLPWPANPGSHHWTVTTAAAVGLAVAAASASSAPARMFTDAVWAGATDAAVAARCRFVSSTNSTIAALRRACVARLRRCTAAVPVPPVKCSTSTV